MTRHVTSDVTSRPSAVTDEMLSRCSDYDSDENEACFVQHCHGGGPVFEAPIPSAAAVVDKTKAMLLDFGYSETKV